MLNVNVNTVKGDTYLVGYPPPARQVQEYIERADHRRIPDQIEQHDRRAELMLPYTLDLPCECETIVETDQR